jgi:hypothetical protein
VLVCCAPLGLYLVPIRRRLKRFEAEPLMCSEVLVEPCIDR